MCIPTDKKKGVNLTLQVQISHLTGVGVCVCVWREGGGGGMLLKVRIDRFILVAYYSCDVANYY